MFGATAVFRSNAHCAPTCGAESRPQPSNSDSVADGFDLLDFLLAEQRTLTAVEEFSARHVSDVEPVQARYYRDLLPLRKPDSGEQLAFQVDLDRCSGCKACVTACHSLNGLDAGESFRDVGLLIHDNETELAPTPLSATRLSAPLSSATAALPILQHVTTACHHCIDPGCLNACPVNAYEKHPVTGIVRHLDDQCFGCQYCTLACPYGVPKYHAAKGIVRKCDMCSQRLAVGEAPACVQACPHHAISITVVSTADAMAAAAESQFLNDAPDPAMTIPTTQFIGRAIHAAGLHAGGLSSETLEHAHVPLILLLWLSQLSVALTLVVTAVLLSGLLSADDVPAALLLAVSAALAACSAMASTIHLGRPQYAFRALLGFRHSWLSREIIAFGIYIPLSFLAAIVAVVLPAGLPALLPLVGLTGLLGVFCSAMVYHITHRPYWSWKRTLPSFVAGACSAASLILATALLTRGQTDSARILLMVALPGLMLRLVLHLQSQNWTDSTSHASRTLVRTSRRLRGPLHAQASALLASVGVAIAACLIALIASHQSLATALSMTSAATAVTAELLDRYLFFRAVVPLSMPGVR